MKKIALIADELTEAALRHECRILNVTPLNYKFVLLLCRPDLLFVESAWKGVRNSWRYKIASYPGHPERGNSRLRAVVEYAKSLGVPAVFWNKEDGVHFDRFIDSAMLFEHIFTVDQNCVPRYRKAAPSAWVDVLPFAVQPKFHNFSGFAFRHNSANFMGSYSSHIHPGRRGWQNMMFRACTNAGMHLTIFDRNSGRKSVNYRFPAGDGRTIRPAVTYERTPAIYRDYLVSLNVNTVEDSPTMFSRRLVEILACGGIAVTNPSPAVESLFHDYCHVVRSGDECEDLLARLKTGPTPGDLDRAAAGADYVINNHTWARRLQQIYDQVGI